MDSFYADISGDVHFETDLRQRFHQGDEDKVINSCDQLYIILTEELKEKDSQQKVSEGITARYCKIQLYKTFVSCSVTTGLQNTFLQFQIMF